MDSDQVIKVSLGCSHLQSYSKALSHFSSIGSKIVEAHHLLSLTLDTDQLQITRVLRSVRHGPLQRPEVLMIHLQVVLAILLDRVLFTETTGSILQRSEHSGADIHIVCQSVRYS